MNLPQRDGASLIFTISESGASIGERLVDLVGAENCEQVQKVNGAGEALRQIHHRSPPLIFVCIAAEQLTATAAMIESIRSRRPELPQLAIAAEHQDPFELTVRAAGCGYYFALDSHSDTALLCETLQALGVQTNAPDAHSGRSPPRTRAAPPIRAMP